VVTVPSEYVRAAVVDAFGIDGERVVIVPHGLPSRAVLAAHPTLSNRATTPDRDRRDLDSIRQRYGLPGPVIVYPAITYPHKNHKVLVQALARLAPGRPDLRLVLLGRRGPAEGALGKEVARLGLTAHVVRPGRVPDADRDAIYAIADVLAFPSRYEGFGAPVLEAMAAGLPVVASDTTALPEVVGGAGLLVPWDDPAAWAESIALLVDDAAEAALLRAAGEARAATFTAARSASALVEAYRRARS
jgi:glycosyltransferase involved in cell wall biosynthesis